MDLWNGDDGTAPGLIAPACRLHAELLNGSPDTTINSPEKLVQWMTQTASPFEAFTFTTLVGPIIDGPYVVGRRVATGHYKGGIPGAGAVPGTVMTFAGTDILRVQDSKIAEYCLSSESVSLLAQLKIGAP
jgi:SnoaL-like polyketide cyclase